jgi:hypothetical protein
LEGQTCLLSGGAPDSHCSCPVRDLLPFLAHSIVGTRDGWRIGHCLVHTGQSGVPNRPLLRATHHPWIAWPTVGAGDRWSNGQSGAPPDSPVNYSRTPPSKPESSEFTADQPGAPDTVWCTTGQSGAPDQSCCLAAHSQVFSNLFLFFSALFLTLRQIH